MEISLQNVESLAQTPLSSIAPVGVSIGWEEEEGRTKGLVRAERHCVPQGLCNRRKLLFSSGMFRLKPERGSKLAEAIPLWSEDLSENEYSLLKLVKMPWAFPDMPSVWITKNCTFSFHFCDDCFVLPICVTKRTFLKVMMWHQMYRHLVHRRRPDGRILLQTMIFFPLNAEQLTNWLRIVGLFGKRIPTPLTKNLVPVRRRSLLWCQVPLFDTFVLSPRDSTFFPRSKRCSSLKVRGSRQFGDQGHWHENVQKVPRNGYFRDLENPSPGPKNRIPVAQIFQPQSALKIQEMADKSVPLRALVCCVLTEYNSANRRAFPGQSVTPARRKTVVDQNLVLWGAELNLNKCALENGRKNHVMDGIFSRIQTGVVEEKNVVFTGALWCGIICNEFIPKKIHVVVLSKK